MKKSDILELLAKSVYQLWSSSLAGSIKDTPRCTVKYENMKDVRVGDIVMELSSAAFINEHINSIGELVKINKGSSEFTDEYVIKRLFDGKLFRWSNCQFIRVPNSNNITCPFDRDS